MIARFSKCLDDKTPACYTHSKSHGTWQQLLKAAQTRKKRINKGAPDQSTDLPLDSTAFSGTLSLEDTWYTKHGPHTDKPELNAVHN